jgi:hypothetical protein
MAFTYRLVLEDGTPADPPIFHTAVPNWRPGDVIPLRPGVNLRVIDLLPAKDLAENGALVVERE